MKRRELLSWHLPSNVGSIHAVKHLINLLAYFFPSHSLRDCSETSFSTVLIGGGAGLVSFSGEREHFCEHPPNNFLPPPPPLSQGPMPAFSAENTWSIPRVLTIHRGEAGLGLSLKGSRPSSVSAVEDGSPAEVSRKLFFSFVQPAKPLSLPQ